MPPFEKDWILARASVDELEAYLLSKTLYWPVTASGGQALPGDLPRFTLGNLLLSLKRLQGAEKSPRQTQEYQSIQQQVQQMRSQWRVHWEEKAKEEFAARMGRWQNFVLELKGNAPPSSYEYAYNVRNRVILTLLSEEPGVVGGMENAALNSTDASLRSRFDSGRFVWEPELQALFPQDEYWYLYGIPAES